MLFLKRHYVLTGILLFIAFYMIATSKYRAGTITNPESFHWTKNYLCNLFSRHAPDGTKNTARPWAMAGMLILCSTLGIFFWRYAGKIPKQSDRNAIRYFGLATMIFSSMIMIRNHDLFTTLASLSGLIALFFLILYLFQTRQTLLLYTGIICILVMAVMNYIYYSHQFLPILPALQKISFFLVVIWFLFLHYKERSSAIFSRANNN